MFVKFEQGLLFSLCVKSVGQFVWYVLSRNTPFSWSSVSSEYSLLFLLVVNQLEILFGKLELVMLFTPGGNAVGDFDWQV